MGPEVNPASQPYTLLIGSALSRGLAKALHDALIERGERVCFSLVTPSAPAAGPHMKAISPDGIEWATPDVAPSNARLASVIWVAHLVGESPSADGSEGDLVHFGKEAELVRQLIAGSIPCEQPKDILVVMHRRGAYSAAERDIQSRVVMEIMTGTTELVRFGHLFHKAAVVSMVLVEPSLDFVKTHPSEWMEEARSLLRGHAARATYREGFMTGASARDVHVCGEGLKRRCS